MARLPMWKFTPAVMALILLDGCGGRMGFSILETLPEDVVEAPPRALFLVRAPKVTSGSQEELIINLLQAPLKAINNSGGTVAEFTAESYSARLDGDYASMMVSAPDGESIYLDMVNGKVIRKPKVRYIGYFVNGVAPARADKASPCGYADENGIMRIAAVYDECQSFSHDYAIAGKPGRFGGNRNYSTGKTEYGLIDGKGNVVVPIGAERIQYIGANRWAVCGGNAPGIFDGRDKQLIPMPELREVVDVSVAAALLSTGPTYHSTLYYAKSGENPVAFPVNSENLRLLGPSLSYLNRDRSTLMLRSAANVEITSVRATNIGTEYMGVQAVDQGGHVGLLAPDGKWVLPPKDYIQIKPFNHGWAAAMVGRGKWRMIDMSGKALFELTGELEHYSARYVQSRLESGAKVESAVFTRSGRKIYGFTMSQR